MLSGAGDARLPASLLALFVLCAVKCRHPVCPRVLHPVRVGRFLRAVLEGRIHVNCADIRRAAPPVLGHRMITNFAADPEGLTPLDIVKKLVEQVPEPGAEAYSGGS